MKPETKARCSQLGEEAKTTAEAWISQFPDDYSGKVRFVLALATAVEIIRRSSPGLQNTGADFIDAVKSGTGIWVEQGEPK